MAEYTVIHKFRDLEDKGKTFPNGRVYEVGDQFPATKRKVADDRIEMLSSEKNKIGKPLIEEVEAEENDNEDETEEEEATDEEEGD